LTEQYKKTNDYREEPKYTKKKKIPGGFNSSLFLLTMGSEIAIVISIYK